MANYSILKNAIAQVIKPNDNQEITGQIMQDALMAMINALGAGYQFAGVPTAQTDPSTPDQNVFYIAGAGTYPNFGATIVPQGSIGIFRYNGNWDYTVLDVANLDFINVNDLVGQSTPFASASMARTAIPQQNRKVGLNITYLLTTGENTSQWVQDMFIGDDVDDWGVADNWKTIGPVSVTQNTLSIGGNYAGEMSTTYDVTLHSGQTFASLSALLSDANINTLIPLAVRKGGMSIKFVQSSDNKYVQYFLPKDEWSANEADWEKMNLEEEVSQLSKDAFGVSRVMRYGVFVTDTSKLVFSSGDTQVIWWKSNQKINKVGGVFVYGVGTSNPVRIYKVIENTEDNTASFELLTTASGEYKELLYIPLDIELGENEYIGQSGKLYVVAKADTDYTFSSWYCSNSAQDSAIVENQDYFPVIGLVCSTMRQSEINEMEKLFVYEAGFPYPSMSDIVISADGENIYWFDDVPVNNITGLSFIGGNGNANFYKVTVNKSNNTASYELLKSVFAGTKELKTISLSVELADNQFIGIGGVLGAYNMGSVDAPFASKYVKLSNGQNANIQKVQYGVMMHLFYNKLQTLPLVQTQTPTYVSGKKVLLYGDSITNGYIPGGSHGTFYENYILQKTNASSVVKRGFDSACCAQKSGWNNYLSDNTRLQDVIAQSPDVLLMLTGTNDYQLGNPIGAIGDGDLTTFLGALTHIITTIMQALPNCVIILCTPTPYYYPMATGGPNYESGRENNSAGKNIRDYADAIIALANQYSIPVCDINAEAGWLDINEATRNFTTDGLHLSQKGYDRITSIQAGFYKMMFSI